MTSSTARWVGLAAIAGFLVLQAGAWDNPDLDVFGVSVPVWLMTLAIYLLGVVAGWAAERSRAPR